MAVHRMLFRLNPLIPLLPFLTTLPFLRPANAQDSLQAVNQLTESLAILREAAGAAGMNLSVANAADTPLTGTILAWEARRGDDTGLTKERADEIEAYVRGGGNLLVTCGLLTWDQLYRLTAVLPTTGWHGMCGRNEDGEKRVNKGATITTWNRHLYPGLDLSGNTIGYHYSIRPFHQVERGIQRYERYATTWRHLAKEYIFTIRDKNYALPAGHTFWTRPLMNRSWRSEIILDNIDGTSLLMAGDCGKGKVAIFATAISETAGWKDCQAFWKKTLDWLRIRDEFVEKLPPPVASSPGERSVASVPGVSGFDMQVLADRATRSFGVRLTSKRTEDTPAEIVARVATWQGALIRDFNATAIVPARDSVTVRWPVPEPGPTGYRALDELDELDVRIGVIGGNGGSMLIEETRHRIHLADPLRVRVYADNLHTVEDYPFPGSAMDHFQGNVIQHGDRMGHPTHVYAVKPGSTVKASVEITYGLRNLSPLATITDELAPENTSVCAINDQGGSYNASPAVGDGILGYSDWRGMAGKANVLRFDFPQPVHMAMVTLVGSVNTTGPAGRREAGADNPGALIVEIDDKAVAKAENLDAQFQAGHGRAFIRFNPVEGSTLRLRFPWKTQVTGSNVARRLPRLADIEVGGSLGEPVSQAPAQPTARWKAVDALTCKTVASGQLPVEVASPGRTTASFEFIAPKFADRKDMRPLRIDVTLDGSTDSIPLMVIDPEKFFRSRTERLTHFYAANGVRKAFPVGTGTREVLRKPPSVAQPDDQVWCYARHLQDGGDHQARRAFAGNQGMDFIPRGWMEFNNDKPFFDLSVPQLVEQGLEFAQRTGRKKMEIMLSDHWHAAPQLDQSWAWQHVVAFDRHLRATDKPGLTGLTHEEVKAEILEDYAREWTLWNLDYYLGRLRALRDGFRAAGLELVIRAQNFPVVPNEHAAEVSEIIAECNDDCTWVMVGESEPLTTARQMTQVICNPYFQWSTLLNWGWVSSILGSPTWQHPVGTCETSRRKYLNRAWPGRLDFEGHYAPMNEIGFALNGGHAFCVGAHEWQEWWQLGEQIALLWPDRPLGPGFVFSSSRFSRNEKPLVGVGEFTLREFPSLYSPIFAWRAFVENSVPLTFGANARSLANYKFNRPLILVGVSEFSEKETESLISLHQRGIGLVATMGGDTISPEMAALFGVDEHGNRTTGTAVAGVLGRDVVRNGRTLLYPLRFEEYTNHHIQAARDDLLDVLDLNIRFPKGVTGYAHYRGKQLFVILEDRLEKGRTLALRLRAAPGAPPPTVCRMSDHQSASVRAEDGWWIIETPTRPGDGTLLCIEGYREKEAAE